MIQEDLKMRKFGYVRVSTKDQHTDRQLTALKPYEIPKKNLYCDYQSGKDFSRPAYQRMLKRMKKGDLLIVKSIDRLGRNYSEILNQWSYITKTLQADILVIDMPLLDTRSKEGDLTGVFVADLVLQILAYVAQTERDFIHQRQAEGIAAAKAKGVKFGRKPVELPEEFEEVCQQWQERKISSRQAAATLGMSHTTFYRRCSQKTAINFNQICCKT
jgi:DNA invertase Pin-like site-specific DNA recombinase